MKNMKCINGFQLKLLAIIFMTIDHVGVVLFPTEAGLRIIGRLAFPIFCFLIVEGVVHTKDIQKYLLRLGLFAFISEIPFDWGFRGLFFYWEMQNVFFTLFLGALAVYLWKSNCSSLCKIIGEIGILSLAEVIKCDYGVVGVFLILWLYNVRGDMWGTLLALGIINCMCYEGVQAYATLAFLPIMFYNGERGYSMKHFFYVYYPVHIVIIGFFSYYII